MTEDNRTYLELDGTIVDGGDGLARAERNLYAPTGTWDGIFVGKDVFNATAQKGGEYLMEQPNNIDISLPPSDTEYQLVTTNSEPLREVMRVNYHECIFKVDDVVVGTFSFGPPFHFEGDVDKSAEIFVSRVGAIWSWYPPLTAAPAASNASELAASQNIEKEAPPKVRRTTE